MLKPLMKQFLANQAARMSFFGVILVFSALFAFSSAQTMDYIGINYGKLGNNLPSPFQSIELIKSTKAGMVKLYDADPETLKLLAGTNLHVSIMVRNEEIAGLATNETLASQWVRNNVFPYYPRTMIRFIMVGNEVYSNHIPEQWDNLVQAMEHIRNTIRSHDIHNIKVGTPVAMDVFGSSFPPSNGTFRVDTLTTIVPLLQFLHKTGSYFFLDVYPYFPWSNDPTDISLSFTLFERSNLTYVDPVSGLVYTNLLDQMLDSVYFAMSKLGFPDLPMAIAETGWPNDGDLDQPGANVYNAATYNRNLIQKLIADPPRGTPVRPDTIPTFLFSLFDENLKDGPGTERHWGLFKPDSSPVYAIDLSGAQTEYEPLPEPTNNVPYEGRLWCVVDSSADLSELGSRLSEMCSSLDGACEGVLGPGKNCYEPVSMVWHASYVFSAYWAKFRDHGTHCYFNGLAMLTATDPSNGTCQFPSVTL